MFAFMIMEQSLQKIVLVIKMENKTEKSDIEIKNNHIVTHSRVNINYLTRTLLFSLFSY